MKEILSTETLNQKTLSLIQRATQYSQTLDYQKRGYMKQVKELDLFVDL